jgi:heat shock protein HslJ
MGARLPMLTLLALCGGLLACSARDQPEPSPAAAEAVVTAAPAAAATALHAATGTPPAALPAAVLDATWQWVSLTSAVEQVEVDEPGRYTVRFGSDGRVALQADCNRGGGNYSVSADGRIELGVVALTKMACPAGSLADRFVRELGEPRKHSLEDGDLLLALPADSGTLRFRRSG